MDGVAQVEARIAEIRSRMASLRPPPVPVPGGSGPTFAAALARAATTTASPTSPAGGSPATNLSLEDRLSAVRLRHSALTATSIDADGAPRALAGYGNGKVPATALSSIGIGGHRLWTPAAEAFGRLRADAARDGVRIGVTDSYRSYEAQVDLVARKGLYSEGGLAAKPGTSDHGWGRALDLDLDKDAQAWMRANGGRYGFVEDTPREPWHWAYAPRP